MANFYMMVGLPGSGKTTFAHNIEKGAIVISSDIIRKELWGSEEKQGDNKIVFEELEKRVMENLAADKSVVCDATNIKAKKRKDFLYRLRKIPNVNTVCMLMSVPYEQCLERNNERGRVVPEEVIKRMYMNFEIPQVREGWHQINIVQPKLEGYDIFEEMDRLCEIEQDNPHHTLTIGKHCIMAEKYLTEHYGTKLSINRLTKLQLATFMHDIGKDFCKTFINAQGVKTEEAHYYFHENVSAYRSLLYLTKDKSLDTVEDVLYVADLIQLHMRPFTLTTDKSIQKLKDKIGIEEFNDLMILHDCDINAK